MNLYEVGKEGLELEELLAASEGELTPELEARFDAFLKGGKEKIDAACKVVRSIEASSQMLRDEADRMLQRSAAFEADAKRLKSRILGAVDAAFDGKVKTNLFTVWGQSTGTTTTFEIAPDADLATIQSFYPEVVRTKYELNKAELKTMHSQGKPLPSAVSVTENPGTRYLRIK